MREVIHEDVFGNTQILLVPESYNSCLREGADSYLKDYNQDYHPEYSKVEEGMLEVVNGYIRLFNTDVANGDKGRMLRPLKKLVVSLIVSVLLCFEHIVRVKCADNSSNTYPVAIYDREQGIYRFDFDYIHRICKSICFSITERELNEIDYSLRTSAPIVERTMNQDLIPVGNGIFHFKDKVLLPFSPQYVFTCKSPVDYNSAAVNVVIHNDEDNTDWDVESWMNELSDDPEIVKVLWELLSAILRPYVAWEKTAWMYGEDGGGGKSTLCGLMRNLVGEESCVSIPLSEMGEKFGLDGIIGKSCVITDENDVGVMIDRVGRLKALVTHNMVKIQVKFEKSVDYQFYGLVIQSLNEYPRTADRSLSFARRQLVIPMTKNFRDCANKKIPEYLSRDDVLQWVLFKVLNMNHYEFSEPCKRYTIFHS